ncbi:putative ATP-dependent RNA helicase DDX60 isoform X2 [Oculina patagonica]
MAEGGEDYHSSSEDDSDVSLFDSDDDENNGDYANREDDGEECFDEEEFLDGQDTELLDEKPEEEEGPEKTEEPQKEEGKKEEQKPNKKRFNIAKCISRVSDCFYGQMVTPLEINILTDFVDAEIFLIDGDSLLLELLGEESLDWSHGGQFLHLTYLLERFLQYFTDKGGVFHIVFFKEMEIIWKTEPSMLLARQAIILHLHQLQNNTRFKCSVVTSYASFWDKQWKEYIDENVPAFLLLTDAENIPWKANRTEKIDSSIEFFFRSLLLHCLGQGLNCVFISGIQMTATKVMGDYVESWSDHKAIFRALKKPVWKTWQFLMRYWRDQVSGNSLDGPATFSLDLDGQIDFQAEVQTALQSPLRGGSREVATIFACAQVLCNVLNEPNTSREAVKTAEDRMKLFLLHTVLLNKLPLKYRAQAVNSTLLDEFCKAKDGKVYPFNEIHTSLWKVLKTIHDTCTSVGNLSLDMSSVADLMDGRLVHSLFSLVLKHNSMGLEGLSLPEDVIKEAEAAWSKVVATVNKVHPSDALESQFFPFFADYATGTESIEAASKQDSCVKLRRLLEVENGLVKEYAGDIRSKINAMAGDESEDEVFNIGREFDERYHWHSLKPLSDDYDRTKQSFTDKPPEDPYLRKLYFKEKQKYVRFHRFYGNSLVGGIDQAKIITVTETEPKKKKGKDKQGKMSKKAAQIIEENKQKGKEQEKERDQEKWHHILKDVESNLKKDNYNTALQLVDKYESGCKSPELRLQALMKKAQSCFDAWQHTRTCEPNSNDMKYPVLLMESIQKIAQDFQSLLSDKDKKKLAGYTQKLGFDNVAATFYDLQPESGKRAGQLSVHMTSVRFQLEHMGHLLKRDERTDADPRVDHFIPDTWQRELLDAVDKNESAVIVAPTSSGKTYASYYCMEKVLRQSNDGVVVYVSPTKPLVNQVVATIYARFHRKQLPEGRAVYGVFTRDYRFNTLNSQILVTVPQCLEILFLSPRRQDWAKNVKYVIFDEVHCLGQEIGAEVWEHLLLLIRCPFLALSATIGNPRDLMGWLQAAQDFREKQDKQDTGKLRNSYRIRLVTCDERYSDLEKSIYLPSPNNGGFSKKTRKYENSYDVQSTEEFVRLHPCSQLGPKQLHENGFPGDMALTPEETLQLYDVMVKHWPDKESLQELSPERYFLESKFIPKSHARQYENELKKEFKSWADEEQSEKVQSVIQSLNFVCMEKQASTEEEWSELAMPSSGKFFICRNFPKLVDQLRAQNKLPALVFSFDRVLCEILSQCITQEFEKREAVLRAKSGPRKLKLTEKRQAKAEKKLKKTRDETEKEKAKRLSSQQGEQDKEDFSALDKPLPECSLAFTHGIGKQDLSKVMGRIWFIKSSDPFRRGLKRGVSYHHAGLNNKKRSVVEMLFREKYLQVITATGTLALGIHMPCKTVVFAGDSPFLNSLQYRQMSGRAGRRGFDPVGNVVFFGVPYRKVQRLITANIPKLVGNFPINVSLVLRLLLMTSKGDDKKDALTKALSLLSHPFICREHPEMESQIKKHFLFSVELLARLSLINKENGAPQEMAGLATHLHYHEPSNYVLVSFLQGGLFHDLCQPGKNGKFSEDVMRKMVLVLSHLFGRRFLHASFKRRIHLCPTSKVILEDLPEEFAEALQEYNRQVTDVFSQYLTTVAAELEKNRGEENKLPLSAIDFPDQASITDLGEHDAIKSLARSSILYSACSSFAALSGNTDLQLHSTNQTLAVHQEMKESSASKGNKNSAGHGNSKSGERGEDGKPVDKEIEDESESDEDEDEVGHREPIDHLLKIIRQDVYTDVNVVPTLPLKKYNSFGCVRRLNAYALDFFKHGSATVIVNENGIKAGDVFTVLKDFCLTIKSISCSLEELGPECDNVVLAFKQLAQEFGQKFKKQFDADI